MNSIEQIFSSVGSKTLYYIEKEMEKRNLKPINFLEQLPNELSLKVLSYLTSVELCSISQACKSLNKLANDQSIWKDQLQRNFKMDYMNEEDPKSVFKNETMTLRNFINGNFRAFRVESSNLISIRDIKLSRNCLVIGTINGQLMFWDLIDQKAINEFYLGYSISCFELFEEENMIATASFDRKVKLIQLEKTSMIEICELTGHFAPITCIRRKDNYLITGSIDTFLIVYNWKLQKPMSVFDEHEEKIIDFQFIGNNQVISVSDTKIIIWDYLQSEIIESITLDQIKVTEIQIKDHVIYLSANVFREIELKIIQDYKIYLFKGESLCFFRNHLVICSSHLNVINIETQTSISNSCLCCKMNFGENFRRFKKVVGNDYFLGTLDYSNNIESLDFRPKTES